MLLADERVDPSDDDNLAIRDASREGHSDVVLRLLQDQRVDPSDFHNEAIRFAAANGHLEIVRILIKDSRVDPYALRLGTEILETDSENEE